MITPRIASLRDHLLHPGVGDLESVRRWAGPAARLFVVVTPGTFAGQRWHEGDVVVCRDPGGVSDGEAAPVVLEARGLGRPRLGSQRCHALYGEFGEVCSPVRWRVAGEVVGVARPADGRQACGSGSAMGVAIDGLPGWRLVEVGRVEGAVAARPAAHPHLRVVGGPERRAPHRAGSGAAPRGTGGQLALFAA